MLRSWLILLCTTLLVLGPVHDSHASPSTWNGSPVRKLGRGVANAAGGVLELPIAMAHTQNEDGIIAGVSIGVLYGIGAAITRSAIGVIEVASFLFPLPEIGYGPILDPEFVFPRRRHETQSTDSHLDY